MINRPFWSDRLRSGWRHAPIVWLTGPRRVGKTVMGHALPDAEFLNCDLPSVAERLRDPESFYRGVHQPRVVFDEVHQLPDPSRLLKIGADEFPHLQILATGSSTLAATSKFRDSLAGRKRVVQLTPVLHEELPAFGITDLRQRLLRGGMPPALLAPEMNVEFYSEWMDSYFARDVQELFHLEKRAAFLRLLELLLRQSGGMLSVTRLAAESEVSRPTSSIWSAPILPEAGAKSWRNPKPSASTPASSATPGVGIHCARKIAGSFGSTRCSTRSSPPGTPASNIGATKRTARSIS